MKNKWVRALKYSIHKNGICKSNPVIELINLCVLVYMNEFCLITKYMLQSASPNHTAKPNKKISEIQKSKSM